MWSSGDVHCSKPFICNNTKQFIHYSNMSQADNLVQVTGDQEQRGLGGGCEPKGAHTSATKQKQNKQFCFCFSVHKSETETPKLFQSCFSRIRHVKYCFGVLAVSANHRPATSGFSQLVICRP
jgi:hypothetical protein